MERGRLTVRRLLALLAVGSAIASAPALAGAGDGPTATAAAARSYAHFTGVYQYRPASFYFGAHELITDVTWSKWRKKLARATGTYQVNDCLPSCAEGTITPTPAVIVLTGRKACGKRFVFRRLKVFFDGRRRGSRGFC